MPDCDTISDKTSDITSGERPSAPDGHPTLLRRRRRGALTDRLRRTRALSRCSDKGLRAIARAGSEVVIPSGWAFLHEATPAHAAYVLLDGDASVYRGRARVATLGTGELVGEMGLLGHRLRTATVASRTRVTALRIDYATLEQVLAREPELASHILAVAAAREDLP